MKITQSPYLFIASMDVEPEREELFNEVYDQEHVPSLAMVKGVIGVGRYERVALTMALSGRLQRVDPTQPKYHAVYELEGPEVIQSDAWSLAVEAGRWPGSVRPFTRNRQHLLIKRIEG
jgi:hypothetical protein